MSSGPLSVALPAELRARLAAEARSRKLKLSTVVRVLVAERIQEIDSATQLSEAERWQRAEAWKTWETIGAETARDAPAEDVAADFERALKKSRRPRT